MLIHLCIFIFLQVLIRESDLLYDTDPDVTSEVIQQKDVEVQEFMQLKRGAFPFTCLE